MQELSIQAHDLYCLETERCAIGAMLCSQNCVNYGISVLNTNSFVDQKNRLIFDVITVLSDKNTVIDVPIVFNEVDKKQKGLGVYISNCAESVPGLSFFKEYCNRIKNYAFRRRLKETCDEINSLTHSESDIEKLSAETEKLIFKSLEREDVYNYQNMNSAIQQSSDRIQKLLSGYQGIKTYYQAIDDKIIWFEEGDFVVVAGRASMGKSMFGLSVAKNQAQKSIPVGIFSLEMITRQIINRWIADETSIPYSQLRSSPGTINCLEGQNMQKVAEELEKLPIWIDDTAGIEFHKLVSKIKLMHRKHKIKVVYIDHIGLIELNDKYQNENTKIGYITRRLKALAKELQIIIIGLCQLNRSVESRTDKHPYLSDLRDSGNIEQDADIVMLLYRDEYYNRPSEKPGILEISIAKGRDCGTGVVELHINTNVCKISDL